MITEVLSEHVVSAYTSVHACMYEREHVAGCVGVNAWSNNINIEKELNIKELTAREYKISTDQTFQNQPGEMKQLNQYV